MIRFLSVFFLFQIGFAQVQQEPDQIETASNEVENNFYEALKHKSMENYDKAIVALEKCIEKETKNPEFYYQLGTNYLALKKYPEAEMQFQKAVYLNPKQRWYWNGLYDVYYQTKDFNKAIPVVEKLTSFDVNMKEDLVSLYMNTSQFDKAKKVLDDIENTSNLTKSMEMYKLQIQSMSKSSQPQVDVLLAGIKENPKVEQNYIDLILYYSTNNQEQKAFETAKKLTEEIPTSDMGHVSLMKFYITQNNVESATESFKRVVKSSKVDLKIKHRVLNEYLIFATKNTQLYAEIDVVLPYFDNQAGLNVYKELAKYFYNKDQFKMAEKYFEKAIGKSSNDVEAIDLLLNTYDFNESYDKMSKKAEELIDLFPAKPNLYYYVGKGQNKLKNYKKAKEYLEMGLDYVVDNKSLESGFYKQLILASEGLSDTKMKQIYQKKLDQIK